MQGLPQRPHPVIREPRQNSDVRCTLSARVADLRQRHPSLSIRAVEFVLLPQMHVPWKEVSELLAVSRSELRRFLRLEQDILRRPAAPAARQANRQTAQ